MIRINRTQLLPTVTLPDGSIVGIDDPRAVAPPALLPKPKPKREPIARISQAAFDRLPTEFKAPVCDAEAAFDPIPPDEGLESGREFLAALAGLVPLLTGPIAAEVVSGDVVTVARRGLERLRLATLPVSILKRDPRWPHIPERLRGRGRIPRIRKIEAMLDVGLS